MDYKAYTLMSILMASLASVVPIGITYAQTEGAATANTTGAATTEEANVTATNATGGGGGGEWTTFDLKAGGQTIPLQYRIGGGSVDNMTIHGENQTLGITISSTGNGTLALRLPRDVMDSKTPEGTDADFAAFIDNAEFQRPGEIESSAANRTVLIAFPQGAGSIDVIGTTVIPEFSTIAVVVLAIAIIGIIIATARQGRFSLGQRM